MFNRSKNPIKNTPVISLSKKAESWCAEVSCASQTGTKAGNQTPHSPSTECAFGGETQSVFEVFSPCSELISLTLRGNGALLCAHSDGALFLSKFSQKRVPAHRSSGARAEETRITLRILSFWRTNRPPPKK